jgi:hypothetical protein
MQQRLILFLSSFAVTSVALLLLAYWHYSQAGAAVAVVTWLIAVSIGLSEDFGISMSYFVSKASGGIEYWTDEGSNIGAVCSGIILAPILLFTGRIAVMMIFHK